MVSYDRTSTVFRALGEPTRLGIVAGLARLGARRVSDIAAEVAMTRPAVSKHLAVLEASGVIGVEWRGREKLCRLRPEALAEARAWIDRHERLWRGALDDLARHFEEPRHFDEQGARSDG